MQERQDGRANRGGPFLAPREKRVRSRRDHGPGLAHVRRLLFLYMMLCVYIYIKEEERCARLAGILHSFLFFEGEGRFALLAGIFALK